MLCKREIVKEDFLIPSKALIAMLFILVSGVLKMRNTRVIR